MASTTVSGGWKWVHVALGVLFVLGALWGFFRPIDTTFALASVLGFLLVLMGAMNIVGAVLSREANPLWWLGLTVGILEILLAMWVSQQYYGARIALILIWRHQENIRRLLKGEEPKIGGKKAPPKDDA